MSRQPFNRSMERLTPGAPTPLLHSWLMYARAEYDRLKGKAALKQFRSGARRRIAAIEVELARRGVEPVDMGSAKLARDRVLRWLSNQWLERDLRETVEEVTSQPHNSSRIASLRADILVLGEELADRGVAVSEIIGEALSDLADVGRAADAATKKLKQHVMYIEEKSGLTGPARIGRVRLSKSGKTLYYAGKRFQSLKGAGFKANYFDIESGTQYWITKCRTDGRDTLYPGVVAIDDDVREEYWLQIRNRPDLVGLARFRSKGKHKK